MKLALLSDVHVHRSDHSADVAALAQRIPGLAVDLVLCAGDLSHRPDELEGFLRQIRPAAPVRCAWVPGNHDIWVIDEEGEEDTAANRYRRVLPEISRRVGWHYLPAAPLLIPEHGLAVVGTMGWFTGPGYSEWFDSEASDADETLARDLAGQLEAHIEAVPPDLRLIAVTHHVPDERCLASGSSKRSETSVFAQAVLRRHSSRLALVVHGHRHRRYGPLLLDGVPYVAHPFGYPHQHQSVDDGVRVLEIP